MSDWKKEKLLVIDFETTGTDPDEDCIVQVGMVGMTGGEIDFELTSLINPGREIPPEASEVHGIKDEDVEGQPEFWEWISENIGNLTDRYPVAYNADFDKAFLLKACSGKLVGTMVDSIPCLREEQEWIDPMTVVKHVDKYKKGKTLVDACERRGIDIANAHSALDDARATGKLLFSFSKSLPANMDDLLSKLVQRKVEQEADFKAYKKRMLIQKQLRKKDDEK